MSTTFKGVETTINPMYKKRVASYIQIIVEDEFESTFIYVRELITPKELLSLTELLSLVELLSLKESLFLLELLSLGISISRRIAISHGISIFKLEVSLGTLNFTETWMIRIKYHQAGKKLEDRCNAGD